MININSVNSEEFNEVSLILNILYKIYARKNALRDENIVIDNNTSPCVNIKNGVTIAGYICGLQPLDVYKLIKPSKKPAS